MPFSCPKWPIAARSSWLAREMMCVQIVACEVWIARLRPMLSSLSGPTWVSLNLGVLICDVCCSVHRGLEWNTSLVVPLEQSSLHADLDLIEVCLPLPGRSGGGWRGEEGETTQWFQRCIDRLCVALEIRLRIVSGSSGWEAEKSIIAPHRQDWPGNLSSSFSCFRFLPATGD